MKSKSMMNAAVRGEHAPGLGLAIYRIVLGIMWLDLCLQKAPWVFDSEGNRYGWLYGWIWTEINNPTFHWYADFLQYFFLPNIAIMGMIVFLQELAIALSLITGTCVPVIGGLLGLVMQINLLIGNYSVPGEWFWTYPLLIVSHLALAIDHAGRVLGVDGWLAQRVERDLEHSGLIARLLTYAV
jgi:thiosulfate dehydrogenase (quinone) large subunit